MDEYSQFMEVYLIQIYKSGSMIYFPMYSRAFLPKNEAATDLPRILTPTKTVALQLLCI